MKVSIIIPTYNRPDYLDRLLKSIKAQVYSDYEVIIVNDNSSNLDDYNRVISKHQSTFNEFVYLINAKNSGAPYSRNKGIDMAKYELLALVDDDDEWLPNKLEKQVKVFENGLPHLGLVYTWTYVFEKGYLKKDVYNSTLSGDVKNSILQNCFIPSPSVMVKKRAIIDAGKFDEEMTSCQDWDMWTRIFKIGFHCDYVKEYLTIYHKHDLETIGMSKNAYNGYKKYYSKHGLSILANLKITGLLILLRHYYGRFLRSTGHFK